MKSLYRWLSKVTQAHAVMRGPAPLARNYGRRKAHKQLARSMKKWGL